MENVSAFVAAHPMRSILGTPKGPGREMERAYNSFRFVCAVARDLNARDGAPNWGVQKKDAGDFLPLVNGQGYWGDGLRTHDAGVDIVRSREGEDAAPAWGTVNEGGPPPEGSFALPPSDADIVRAMGGTPVPEPPPEEPPAQPPATDPLADRVAALEVSVGALTKRVSKLEQAPTPPTPQPPPSGDMPTADQIAEAVLAKLLARLLGKVA